MSGARCVLFLSTVATVLLLSRLAVAAQSGGDVEVSDFEATSTTVSYSMVRVADSKILVADFEFTTQSPTFMLDVVSVDGSGGGDYGGFASPNDGQSGQQGPPDGGYGGARVQTLTVLFDNVVEFVDRDGDGAYTPGQDETGPEHSLRGSSWTPIEYSELEDGVEFRTRTTFSTGGSFEISAIGRGNAFQSGDVQVTPFSTKIDLEFHGFAYSMPDSQLALEMTIEGSTVDVDGNAAMDVEDGGVVQGAEKGVVLESVDDRLYYTWTETATVDGEPKPVRHFQQIEADEVESEGASVVDFVGILTFAYARGDDIVHDPRLGVQFDSAKAQGLPGVEVPWLLCGLVLLLLLVRSRRPT